MAAPLRPAGKDHDQGRRRGAVAAAGTADPNRKRRLAALAVLAALIVLAAVLLIIRFTGSSHHTASPARHPAATSAATGPAAAATPAATPGNAAAGAGALPAYGLVGGGGVTARPATGKLAVKGSAGDILFAEDGTALDASARQVVTAAAQEIRQHHPATVTVTGYTDATGNAAANDRLSLQRANVVIQVLRAQLGSTVIHFQAAARGQGAPVAANSTAIGRQLNRRVVISLG